MQSIADYNKRFADIDASIVERNDALHANQPKRVLPEEIPRKKDFAALREDVASLKKPFMDRVKKLTVKEHTINLVKVNESMATFLRLPESFEGYYSSRLLLKVMNLYISLHGLSNGKLVTLDERLATAYEQEEGEVARTALLRLNYASYASPKENIVDDETMERLTPIIIKEEEDITTIKAIYQDFVSWKLRKRIIDELDEDTKPLFSSERKYIRGKMEIAKDLLAKAIESSRIMVPE
jgi:hypothetical protein